MMIMEEFVRTLRPAVSIPFEALSLDTDRRTLLPLTHKAVSSVIYLRAMKEVTVHYLSGQLLLSVLPDIFIVGSLRIISAARSIYLLLDSVPVRAARPVGARPINVYCPVKSWEQERFAGNC